MLRNARHTKILEIIEKMEIETQEELCEQLAACNFSVTQATVSRDIKELHLFKVKGNQKRFRYASMTEKESGLSDYRILQYNHLVFRTCVLEIRAVGNLIVVKTLNGNGANAGVVIDHLDYREVVGCISGDDTVLIICENNEEAKLVTERLNAIVKS